MVQIGFDRPRADDPMLRSGKGIIGHVIHTGETILAPDVRKDPRYVAGRSGARSELAVPIVSNEKVIGALNVESDRLSAFTSADADLLSFFASAAALSIEKTLLHRKVVENERIENQLNTARDVQAGLLPRASPEVPGYEIAAVNLPTWTIGGDYYDYIPLVDGRMGMVIADVSGKGIPAALIMATFRAALRTELRERAAIDGLVESLNRTLLDSQRDVRFVTAVYGVLEPSEGRLTYVNCGHNPPMLLRADGSRELLDRGGPALGLFESRGYEAATLTLRPGDTLALYTDGVVEPADAGGVEFGLHRLEGVLRQSAALPASGVIRRVIEATRAFSGRDAYDDDFTLVLMRRWS
jgi:sigma-B regulation protein RsbU (phosphoserine phosphatase)